MIGSHGGTGVAHPFDYLGFGKLSIIESHRHHSPQESSAGSPDSGDFLRLAFQFLFSRARGLSSEMQDRLAILLVAQRSQLPRQLTHFVIREDAGIEIDGYGVIDWVQIGLEDSRLVWSGQGHQDR